MSHREMKKSPDDVKLKEQVHVFQYSFLLSTHTYTYK